jgi:hypothetical protein
MSQRIIFLVTFDYEISLGKNFMPLDKVLFEPTAQVLEVCERDNIPSTFFPDVCSVWAHRNAGLNDYVEKFEAQMRDALRAGHDVQLHLHPHWLDSTYKNGDWEISTDKMYLSELGYGAADGSARALIQRGVNYLNELLLPVNPDYRCLAFRAAGLALQPGEKELIRQLLDCSIKLDVSIVKGLKMTIDTISNDYSRVPAQANWLMSPESGIEAAASNGLLEIPVASFQSGFATQLRFLVRRARSIKQMRGTTLSRAKRQSKFANLKTLVLQNLRYVIGRPQFILSCDTKGFDLKMLLAGFDDYLLKHQADEVIYVCMMNHPKLMFDDQMNLLSQFVRETRSRYDIAYVTCTQALEMYHRQA